MPRPAVCPVGRIDHHLPMLLARLVGDAVLDAAHAWLCRRRRDYPAQADIWSFRRRWPVEKQRLRAALLAGEFRFGLLDRITRAGGEDIDLWSARDALVLKALAIVLAEVLPVSPQCTHVKGHGGAKAAVRQAEARLRETQNLLDHAGPEPVSNLTIKCTRP